MRALDTNVLARFFIDDPDDEQAARQRPAAIDALSDRAFVPITVLLEFEWVMRGFYELSRKDTTRVLRALVGIEHVTIEDRAAVLMALDAFDTGMDLADALHVSQPTGKRVRDPRSPAGQTSGSRLGVTARRRGPALLPPRAAEDQT